MVLRLVPLVITIGSSITGGVGVIAGTLGGVQMMRAKTQIELYEARYMKRYDIHLAKVACTEEVLQAFGRTQDLAQRDVIFRMRNFLELHGKQVRANEHRILDGVDGSNIQVPGLAKLDLDVAYLVGGFFVSVVAGVATPVALRDAVFRLGNASTGTPIKFLSGAAAEKAILAFFGGGSRASGGGGTKLGVPMLHLTSAGVGLIIAGVTVKNQGTKARTTADERRAEISVAIADLDRHDEALRGMRKWAHEQDEILVRLASQATQSLDFLESEPFDADLHTERLQTPLILVKSVGEVMGNLTVFNEEGNLDGNTEKLSFKYRDSNTEATNDQSERITQGQHTA